MLAQHLNTYQFYVTGVSLLTAKQYERHSTLFLVGEILSLIDSSNRVSDHLLIPRRYDAHPTAILTGAFAYLGSYYSEANPSLLQGYFTMTSV